MESRSTPRARFMSGQRRKSIACLDASAEIFNFHYGVEANGNAPDGADPHGEFVGKNILIEKHSLGETAAHFGKSEDEVRELLASVAPAAICSAGETSASASGR